MKGKLKKEFNTALATILPVVIIVLFLVPFMKLNLTEIYSFLFSAFLLIIGSTLFTFGAEYSMILIGNKIGKDLVKSKKISLILIVSFIIGTLITVAEPDLLVLAEQISSVPTITLVLIIGLGVGLCTLLASLRALFGWSLNVMLFIGFFFVFLLVFFVPADFIPFAFDSGGVTTGTMSIPFLLTLGMGLVSSRIDKKAKEDSFGLVSLASTGPIIMVLVLGLFYTTDTSMSFDASIYQNYAFSNYIPQIFAALKDVLIAISPIVVVFIIYELISKNATKREVYKIIFGMIATIIGLTLFLTACNVGFMNMGYYIGDFFADNKYILIPIIMIFAFFIAIAEPAVIILIEQIKDFTEGGISEKTMKIALAIGVSLASGLAMLRVITATPFFYYAITGYGIALMLTFATPKVFTAIAFDAGGATGGSLTTAFLLPMAAGACMALGGNVYTDAFGLASMVSLVPIITVEIIGISYQIKTSIKDSTTMLDDSIVDFNWEVA